MNELLSVAEAAEYLTVTERWVRQAITERHLPHIRLGRKFIRLRRSDLDRYLAAQTIPATGRGDSA